MQYLSSVYFVNQLLHVSDIFVANHQEVYCIYTTIGTVLTDLDIYTGFIPTQLMTNTSGCCYSL